MTTPTAFPHGTAVQALIELYHTAVRVSQPQHCMASWLSTFSPDAPICILGAGKAAAEMAAEAYDYFGDACYGAVVTRYGYHTTRPTGNIEVMLAAHPIPDENSLRSGKRLLQLAENVPDNVPVLFLISGGGSALACVPAQGLSLADKIQINRFLLQSGAAIDEINTVRKHLSAIKGGRLAAATRKTTTSLVISDVVGDDPAFIASGLTLFDATTPNDALAILQKYRFAETMSKTMNDTLTECVLQSLQQARHVATLATDYHIIANARQAIDAAVAQSQADGWETQVLSYDETGEARDVAIKHAQIALAMQAQQRVQSPANLTSTPTPSSLSQHKGVRLFSGGELTVTLQQNSSSVGEGGPNQEYLLALALALKGAAQIYALAGDTDGVDGSRDVAGGFIGPETLQQAKQQGLAPDTLLAQHNSFHFFQVLQHHLVVAPTRTNVNDFRVIEIRYDGTASNALAEL